MLYKAEFNSPIGPLGLLADKEKILKLSFKGLKDIKEEAKEDPSNFLLMHAMGPNVAGVIGTATVAGVLLAIVPNLVR